MLLVIQNSDVQMHYYQLMSSAYDKGIKLLLYIISCLVLVLLVLAGMFT
jgi:heme/copper-type cytochrome/quinol oxidase subunit 4